MNRFLVKSITSLLAGSSKSLPLFTPTIGLRTNLYFGFCSLKAPQNNNHEQNQLKDGKK